MLFELFAWFYIFRGWDVSLYVMCNYNIILLGRRVVYNFSHIYTILTIISVFITKKFKFGRVSVLHKIRTHVLLRIKSICQSITNITIYLKLTICEAVYFANQAIFFLITFLMDYVLNRCLISIILILRFLSAMSSLRNKENVTMLSLFKNIIRTEGFLGLYRGITPNFMKVSSYSNYSTYHWSYVSFSPERRLSSLIFNLKHFSSVYCLLCNCQRIQ